ncbi:hypothetical protein RHS04_07596, partial [Rhizoctonia solani]
LPSVFSFCLVPPTPTPTQSLELAQEDAVATTGTRHSLTSNKHFSKICAGFNYLKFYNQVCKFLEDPKYCCWSKELVEWWNKWVFNELLGGLGAAALGREHGTLLMLDAQLETQDLNVGNGGVEGVAA